MNNWNIERIAQLADGLTGPVWARVVQQAERENAYFTPSNVERAAKAIRTRMLDRRELQQWLSAYEPPRGGGRRVGLVMAGNLPMVGFFDLLAVAAAGHAATVKPSSKDAVLMSYVVELMAAAGFDVELTDRVDRMDVDAVVVTGSDEAVRYFRQEFRGLPGVYRGSRRSLAVVEAVEQVNAGLIEDMFAYWGMGCRSVSHLLLPTEMNVADLAARFVELRSCCASEYEAFGPFADNYRYGRAMAALSGQGADCDFFLLTPCEPTATVGMAQIGYSFYVDQAHREQILDALSTDLQCVSRAPFGQCQYPQLWDYADGIDLMDFLLKLYD